MAISYLLNCENEKPSKEAVISFALYVIVAIEVGRCAVGVFCVLSPFSSYAYANLHSRVNIF